MATLRIRKSKLLIFPIRLFTTRQRIRRLTSTISVPWLGRCQFCSLSKRSPFCFAFLLYGSRDCFLFTCDLNIRMCVNDFCQANNFHWFIHLCNDFLTTIWFYIFIEIKNLQMLVFPIDYFENNIFRIIRWIFDRLAI